MTKSEEMVLGGLDVKFSNEGRGEEMFDRRSRIRFEADDLTGGEPEREGFWETGSMGPLLWAISGKSSDL